MPDENEIWECPRCTLPQVQQDALEVADLERKLEGDDAKLEEGETTAVGQFEDAETWIPDPPMEITIEDYLTSQESSKHSSQDSCKDSRKDESIESSKDESIEIIEVSDEKQSQEAVTAAMERDDTAGHVTAAMEQDDTVKLIGKKKKIAVKKRKRIRITDVIPTQRHLLTDCRLPVFIHTNSDDDQDTTEAEECESDIDRDLSQYLKNHVHPEISDQQNNALLQDVNEVVEDIGFSMGAVKLLAECARNSTRVNPMAVSCPENKKKIAETESTVADLQLMLRPLIECQNNYLELFEKKFVNKEADKAVMEVKCRLFDERPVSQSESSAEGGEGSSDEADAFF